MGKVEFRPERREVLAEGCPVHLTNWEMGILVVLADGLPKGKKEIHDGASKGKVGWLGTETDKNNLRVYVRRIREKLGDGVIETLHGEGYRLGREVEVVREWKGTG